MRIQLNLAQPNSQQNLVFNNKNETEKVSSDNISENKDIKQRNGRHIGAAISVATIATVASTFMLSKGVQKNTNKYLNKIKTFLENKFETSSLKKSKKSSKFYEYSLRSVNSFIKKSESINNITSLKDILFMRLMYKSKTTKNIHKSVSDYFEKVSRKTILDSYKKNENDFKKMNHIFDELDNYILTNFNNEKFEYQGKEQTAGELINQAKKHRSMAMDIVNSFMCKEALENRYNYINEVTSKLYSKFWDASFKDFWSKNNKFKRKEMWQTFIAAEQIKGDKTHLAEYIAPVIEALTYSNTDKTKVMQEYIKKLDEMIPPKDQIGIDIIKKLQWFIKNPDGLKDNKKLFTDELDKLKEHKITSPNKDMEQTLEDTKQAYIGVIDSVSNETATGVIQDMMSIYYKIAPFELEKSGALLAVNKAVKSLNKSINLEIVEFFDKVRDLKLGSAPTDVLTILFSFIALSVGLGYAENREKRNSIILKSGIPIAGAIATTTFATTKLVSGGKSLALGFLSGIVLNQIGKIADNMHKKTFSTSKEELIA